MFDINSILRNNIKSLKPYSCARDEFSGIAQVYLDANENPYNAPYNRYPDPLQLELKERIAEIKGVPAGTIFIGNGSDEPIDIIFRALCEPGVDNVVAIAPSYGMYQVAADINNVTVKQAPLNADFSLNSQTVLDAVDAHTKAIFLCSPNNPSANALNGAEMVRIIESFGGLVVVDEAYIDFVPETSLLPKLAKYPNLVVLQTFSKAWGMAGVRLGMAFADESIIHVFNKIKYPYNINILTQQEALKLLAEPAVKDEWVKTILTERTKLVVELEKIAIIERIYPSDANFVLVKVADANKLYNHLMNNSVIVRNRTRIFMCENTIRMTVGTPEENRMLIESIKSL